MRKEGREGGTKGAIRHPVVKPEGSGGTIDNFDISDRSKGVKFIGNNFP
jgi:hypothetical protein